jgi:hypothetical protein
MNARIEYLFKHAGGYVEYDKGQILTYTQDLDVEKFAELIVRECGNFTDAITRNLMFLHFGDNHD